MGLTLGFSILIYYLFVTLLASIIYIFQRHPSFHGHPWKRQRLRIPYIHSRSNSGDLVSEWTVWVAVAAVQILQFAYWAAVYGGTVADFLEWGFWSDIDWWKVVFLATGYNASIQMSLTLLPTSRAGILSTIFHISNDSSIRFHRRSGWIAVILSFVHGFAFCVYTYLRGGMKRVLMLLFMWGADAKRWRSYKGWIEVVGLISVSLFLWVAVNSLDVVRRRKFNWFYFNHFAVLGAIVAAFIHASPVVHYVLPSLALYAADACVRLFNRASAFEAGELTVEPCGYIRLDIKDCDLHAAPGQWVSICVPAVSEFEWHPFTVVRSSPPVPAGNPETHPLLYTPTNSTHAGMSLVIKPADSERSWTRSLLRAWNKARTNDVEGSGKLKVHIEGPYGSLPPAFLSSPYVLILVGGSGVPGGIAIARAALASPHVKKVWFVWTTREPRAAELSCYQDLVADGEAYHAARAGGLSGGGGDRKLVTEVVVTGKGAARMCVESIVKLTVARIGEAQRQQALSVVEEGILLSSLPQKDQHHLPQQQPVVVSLYACGPASLNRAVRRATSYCSSGGLSLSAASSSSSLTLPTSDSSPSSPLLPSSSLQQQSTACGSNVRMLVHVDGYGR
ncbi:ferric/cupric-chelate reductase [Borealophlyctis nickersoniae]|nr:ferric/cupric-chelate reductase [Borealophlyctis nickersoniae]